MSLRLLCCCAVVYSFITSATQPLHAQGSAVSSVIVSPVLARQVGAMQMFVGTVMPEKSAKIGSAVDGRVVEFPIVEGERVEAGQKLAQLLTRTITLELTAAEAELQLRQHRLQELQNGSRPEEIEQARARMAATKLRHEFLTARRDRMRIISRQRGAISEEEFEEAISTAGEAEQAYLEAKAVYDMAVAGPRTETIAQARSQVAIHQAMVENLRDRIKKHTIISRFAGYVVAEHSEIGQWVNRGDAVAEIIALDQVEVVAQVVEQSMPFVQQGMVVRVDIPTFADRLFEGIIIKSAPQADVRARTFPVRIKVKNEITSERPLLKAGMVARVALPVGKQQLALLVPKDAIVLGGPKPTVYVVDAPGSVEAEVAVRAVAVTLGVSTGSMIQVIGDLLADQLVVVEGNERLRPKQKVRIVQVKPGSPDPR